MTWWQAVLVATVSGLFAVAGILIGVLVNRNKLTAEVNKIRAEVGKAPLEVEKIQADIAKTLRETEKISLEAEKLRQELGAVKNFVSDGNRVHGARLDQIHLAVSETVEEVRQLDAAVKTQLHWQISPEMVNALRVIAKMASQEVGGRLSRQKALDALSNLVPTDQANSLLGEMVNRKYLNQTPSGNVEVTSAGRQSISRGGSSQ
uniref:hypothetical protein n=1 Tax=Herbidospora sakaeratensis TaxID=564415 RepID=UPI0012FAF754|nr:hypothetical protein [Herbidospora sakaeratensis]